MPCETVFRRHQTENIKGTQMSIVEIKVPDIGGHENVDIIAVEVKAGDTIAVDDTLITLETDKATMDVPADAAGVVKEVKVKVGDKISEGGVILTVETDAAAADAAPVLQLPLPLLPQPLQAGQTVKSCCPGYWRSYRCRHYCR
ncbi:dihydrolipoamide acetyltransferase [Neisseria subflava NJ9703]|uniref:Dihydrolipoamide acetyltransferase n=1 Tax=Neisseria subflava NJ9703 TaxID=546268 RepID=A0A9W5MYW6_NEISU|nr:dihydrolipoamide acetyltransferase [Neisseria subflava NJ9703]